MSTYADFQRRLATKSFFRTLLVMAAVSAQRMTGVFVLELSKTTDELCVSVLNRGRVPVFGAQAVAASTVILGEPQL